MVHQVFSLYCPYWKEIWNHHSPPTFCCSSVLLRGAIGFGSPLVSPVYRYVYIYTHTHIFLMLQVHHYSSSSSSSQGNTFLSGPEKNSDQVQLPSHMKHLEQYTQVLAKAPVIHFTINILQWTLQWNFHLAKITSFEAKVMYVLCYWTSSYYQMAERTTHKIMKGWELK